MKKLLAVLIALSISCCVLVSCEEEENSSPGKDSDVSLYTRPADDSSEDESASLEPEESSEPEAPDDDESGPDESKDKEPARIETSLTVNGREIDTDGLIMCTIEDYEVSFDEFRYYWLSYCKSYQDAGYDMASEETLENIKNDVEYDLLCQYGIIALGAEYGVEYGDDVQQDFEKAYESIIADFDTSWEYADALSRSYLTDSALRSYYYSVICTDKAVDFLYSDESPFIKTQDDFLKAVRNGELCRTLHVLITFEAGAELSAHDLDSWDNLSTFQKSNKYYLAYEALSDEEKAQADIRAKDIAHEVQKRAKNGEDFYGLIAQYNLDPGMDPNDPDDPTGIDGYYITKEYGYVQEYLDAAFSLKENEVSDVIETDYGYHIIKRLPIDMNYVNENIADMTEEYSRHYIDEVVADYLDSIEVQYCDIYYNLTTDSIK